ncbi:hypothetical protein V3851_03030 [Paenibacillus sp. M1]|uniref:Mycothiol-dependent maleylpyruvate isomerase metal-binding domain-containing protein n=1 Tax=Paenibacillus haidiansis TaxID=1574488 RepID=A0ABU7VLZ5_9BACL
MERLQALIEETSTIVNEIEEEEFARKPLPDKWSKQEILGHLCD